MIDLKGKVAVVFGLANKRSIAWGIAQKLSEAGATLAICYQSERLQREAEELARPIFPARKTTSAVTSPSTTDIDARLRDSSRPLYGKLDILVHSIGFAPKKKHTKTPSSNTTREDFRIAHDVSAYSLIALARARGTAHDRKGGSILTLSYYGAEKVVPELQRHGRSQSGPRSRPCATSRTTSD